MARRHDLDAGGDPGLLAAKAAGVGLILPGHYATERPAVEELAEKLRADLPGAAVWASRAERDPVAGLA